MSQSRRSSVTITATAASRAPAEASTLAGADKARCRLWRIDVTLSPSKGVDRPPADGITARDPR